MGLFLGKVGGGLSVYTGSTFRFPHLGEGSLQTLLTEKLAIQAVPNFRFRSLLHLWPSMFQSSARESSKGRGRLVSPRAIVRCFPLLLHFKRPQESRVQPPLSTSPSVPRRRATCALKVCFVSSPLTDFPWASPLRRPSRLLTMLASRQVTAWSSRFCPPLRYRASQAEASSLLRAHLPPHTA